jgi:hypothetical protein
MSAVLDAVVVRVKEEGWHAKLGYKIVREYFSREWKNNNM